MDSYVWSARVAPAAAVVTPAIAFGLVLGAKLDAVNDLWGLVSFALIPLAAALSRHAGHRVQEKLWTAWGGAPASRRLWVTGTDAPAEVQRRRSDVVAVLGDVVLPTVSEERDEPQRAEAEYRAVVRRVIGVLRNSPTALMTKENAYYGFTRNLYGLKPYGIAVALVTTVLSIGLPLVGPSDPSWSGPWWAPAGVGVIALVVWALITPGVVRPAAEAWADRLYEAVQLLVRSPTGR